jgi:hypothetical protein
MMSLESILNSGLFSWNIRFIYRQLKRLWIKKEPGFCLPIMILNQIFIEFESTGQPLGDKQKEEVVTFVKLMFDEKVFTGFASYYHN